MIGNEDCLTLDVRTPAMRGKLPVLVWIHGGSNRAGGPNDIVLSDVGKQVVIVGVRYRLGIFGFLSHRKLTAEQGASGNYGLMDQIAALRWVQRNIAKFGGDPNNVTIAGESAGSQDVSLMLAGARRTAAVPEGDHGKRDAGVRHDLPAAHRRRADRRSRPTPCSARGGDLAKLRQRFPRRAAGGRQASSTTTRVESDDMIWLRITVDGKALPATPAPAARRGAAQARHSRLQPLRVRPRPAASRPPSSPRRSDAATRRRAPFTARPARPAADPRLGTPRRADCHRRHLPLPGRAHGRDPGGQRRAGLALRVRCCSGWGQDVARGRNPLCFRRLAKLRAQPCP